MDVPHIVSVHFPKAGGTSLAAQFNRFLPDLVAFDYTHDPVSGTNVERVSFPAGRRVVHGYFRADRYAGATDAFWMTFLRHPVDNLISIFDFWSTYPEHGNPVHTRFLRERPSVVEFASYPAIENLMSSTYFGGFDMGRFDFIGFFETRGVDMTRLAGLLSLPFDAAVHENRTQTSAGRNAVAAAPAERARLRDLLAEDLAFYERAWRRH